MEEIKPSDEGEMLTQTNSNITEDIFNIPKLNEIFLNSNQYASNFENVYITCLHSTNLPPFRDNGCIIIYSLYHKPNQYVPFCMNPDVINHTMFRKSFGLEIQIIMHERVQSLSYSVLMKPSTRSSSILQIHCQQTNHQHASKT